MSRTVIRGWQGGKPTARGTARMSSTRSGLRSVVSRISRPCPWGSPLGRQHPLLVHPRGDQIDEVPLRTEAVQRAVPRADQIGGRRHDVFQYGTGLHVRADRHHRVQQPPQPALPEGQLPHPGAQFLGRHRARQLLDRFRRGDPAPGRRPTAADPPA
ncbi:hypothetical protein ACIPD2_13800 [Streptomyces griseofuscus]|uniref:hypothetical protein n=1 Tax=Streptomyces griseofuscus TaxID=146922 RepID=UPI003808091B